MALYEWQCPQCKELTESTILDVSLICDHCKQPLEKVVSRSSVIFRGEGFTGGGRHG